MIGRLHPDEQVVELSLTETEWAAVVAGLYALENQQRRLHHERNAMRVHDLRRAIHKGIGQQLVDRRGTPPDVFTFGFPDDEP